MFLSCREKIETDLLLARKCLPVWKMASYKNVRFLKRLRMRYIAGKIKINLLLIIISLL